MKKAFAVMVAGALLSGVSGLIIKAMTIPPTSMAWIRTTVPVVIMGAWIYYRRVPFFRGNIRSMLSASFLNAARMFLFFTAFINTSISNAILAIYTWPVFATLLGVIILKERVHTRQILLLCVSLIGVLFVYSSHEFSIGNDDFLGLSAALGSAFLFAWTMIIFKSEIDHYSRPEIIFYQNLMGPLIFLPFFLNNPIPGFIDWSLGITHGILIGLVVFGCFFYGLRLLKASVAAMITYIEIVSAVSLGIIFHNDTLTWNMVVGGLMIIGTTLMLRVE